MKVCDIHIHIKLYIAYSYLKLRSPIVLAYKRGLVEVPFCCDRSKPAPLWKFVAAAKLVGASFQEIQSWKLLDSWMILEGKYVPLEIANVTEDRNEVLESCRTHPEGTGNEWCSYSPALSNITTRIPMIFLLPYWFTKSYVVHAIH